MLWFAKAQIELRLISSSRNQSTVRITRRGGSPTRQPRISSRKKNKARKQDNNNTDAAQVYGGYHTLTVCSPFTLSAALSSSSLLVSGSFASLLAMFLTTACTCASLPLRPSTFFQLTPSAFRKTGMCVQRRRHDGKQRWKGDEGTVGEVR